MQAAFTAAEGGDKPRPYTLKMRPARDWGLRRRRLVQPADGSSPLARPQRAQAKCLALIRLLATIGHELRRPRTDALRDGIRELRTEVGNVNYRILYFSHGTDCVVLTHGITKEGKVPDAEINSAVAKRLLFKANPDKHTFYETEQYYEEAKDTEDH